jgi:hypothetical protein
VPPGDDIREESFQALYAVRLKIKASNDAGAKNMAGIVRGISIEVTVGVQTRNVSV